MGMNTALSVQGIARLTHDPDPIKTITSGGKSWQLCKFPVAFVQKKAKKQEDGTWAGGETCFIRCEVWGPLATVCSERLSKGAELYITGELHLSEWTDKNTGEKKQRHFVRVDTATFTYLPELEEAPKPKAKPVKASLPATNGHAPKNRIAEIEPMEGSEESEGVEQTQDDIPF